MTNTTVKHYWVTKRYEGQNVLERLWMEFRHQLRDGNPAARSGAWTGRIRIDCLARSTDVPHVPREAASPPFRQEPQCRSGRSPHSNTSESRGADRGEGRAPGGCPRRLPAIPEFCP